MPVEQTVPESRQIGFGGRELLPRSHETGTLAAHGDIEGAAARRTLGRAFLLLAAVPGGPAPRVADQEIAIEGGKTLDVHSGGPARLTLPVNVAGLPSVAFPVGLSSDGMPLGAQLMGPEWSELRLCSIVSRYQEATDWHLHLPSSAETPPRDVALRDV